MNNINILNEIKYLLFKYLEKNFAENKLKEFKESREKGVNTGKDFFYTLSTKKRFPFEPEDKIKIKELAYHLGI